MSLTPNYDINPLEPKIIITDRTGVEKYRYETTTTTTSVSPQQDFKLSELAIHMGVNSDYGYCILKIEDPDNILTDVTKARRSSKIERQWDIQVYLGKSQALLQRWFYGKIYDVDIVRPATNRQSLVVMCMGWGTLLKDRITNIKRFQSKTADGITTDSNDTSTKISELIKDVVQDTDHQADQGIDNSDLGITVNGVVDLDLKLNDLQETFATYAQTISTLSSTANMMWGVDADRDLFLRDPGSVDSGFLFTNDLSSDTATNWDSSRIGYLLNASNSWRDSSFNHAFSVIHGLGSNSVKIDQQNSGSENAVRQSHTSWIGIPFTPETDNIGKLAIRMAKTGTPATNTTFEIVGVDTSASNAPKRDNLRKSISIPASKLQTFSTSGDWAEFSLDEKLSVNPDDPLMLVLHKYGDSSHNYTMDYRTGTGTFWTSADGNSWSSATGLFSIRVYNQKSLQIILENTRAKQKYGTREKVVNISGGQEEATAREAMISAGEVLGLERRTYSQITVSPPTYRVPLGEFCRIIDSKTGLNTKANISTIDVVLSVRSNSASIGADKISLGLEEVHY